MKKILYITGTRADFGKMLPLLNVLEQHPDFELHVLVTGMHMLKTYGSTHLEVSRQGFARIYLVPNQIQGEPMAAVLGNTVSLLTRLADEIRPDMIMVHGDRIEALAGATVGALGNYLVCHIEGGELSGTIDDAIRHAVSKLSHLHLVANEAAQNRLLQMGEQPESIAVIGSPDLDAMLSEHLPDLDEVKRHYAIPFDDYAVSLFHPVTTEIAHMRRHARQYFQALKNSGRNYIAVYPNNDLGTEAILSELADLDSPNFRIFPSIRFEAFLVLLKNARFIIGNSSAGIREAPFYGVPSIDVGTRQEARHNGASIIRTGYAEADIAAAIDSVGEGLRFEPDDAFKGGSQSSAERFAEFIGKAQTWQTPIQKRFADFPRPGAAEHK